jgi:hypothetical protein
VPSIKNTCYNDTQMIKTKLINEVPNIKNTCYNGTQIIKTKLISDKIMMHPRAHQGSST